MYGTLHYLNIRNIFKRVGGGEEMAYQPLSATNPIFVLAVFGSDELHSGSIRDSASSHYPGILMLSCPSQLFCTHTHHHKARLSELGVI